MDPSEVNSFDNQWRRAFEGASETPPPNIWENIEAHLDENGEKGAVIPLWWRSPKLWFAAASVAATILVGAGIWYSNETAQNNAEIAISQPAENSSIKENEPAAQTDLESTERVKTDATSEHIEPSGRITARHYTARQQTVKKNPSSVPSVGEEKIDVTSSSTSGASGNTHSGPEMKIPGDKALQSTSRGELAGASVSDRQEAGVALTNADEKTSVGMLDVLAVRDLDVHVQKRYVFFQDKIDDAEPPKIARQEYWAGVSFMPSSFNPNVKVRTPPQAFSYQALSNQRSVSGASKPGMSYAFQSQAGMQLSKHWSLEMGVSYLQGNSTYQGGGYLVNSYASRVASSVLENALAGFAASPTADAKNAQLNAGALYVDVANKVDNNYRYFQLPVQAGFTLNPDKKLSYSLLGGMMANYFLSNQLESASGEYIITKVADDIYRDVTWTATTGLRFNYRISGQWKATLTGSYQRSLTSGFRSNQSLDAHSYLYGVAWGVRYSF